jgi:AraC-like DNA-binding protein
VGLCREGFINLQSTLARGFVLPNGAPNPLHPPAIVRLSMALDGTEFARICRARDRLCDLQTPSMTVDRIAREAGISHFHFIRRFRAIFGVTPHQYRIDARLRDARLHLAKGDSVTEACLSVGFESVGSFSQLFARRVGVSPAEYRRSSRASVTVPGSLSPVYFPGCLSLMASLPAAAFRNFRVASIFPPQ